MSTATADHHYATVNPYTGERCATFADWRARPIDERAAIVRRAAELMTRRREQLARLRRRERRRRPPSVAIQTTEAIAPVRSGGENTPEPMSVPHEPAHAPEVADALPASTPGIASAPPATLSPKVAHLLSLQRTAGNRAVVDALATGRIGRLLTGAPTPVSSDTALARQATDERDARREGAPGETPVAGPPAEAPAAADLDKTKEKVEQMIRTARQAGLRYAADNLEHWYRGSATPLVMPSAAFTREKFLVDHLRNVHGSRFAQGAENRARASGLKVGGTATMTWTDSVRAPGESELFYALGGFTVESTMEVTASAIPDDPGSLLITVTRWTVKCSDFYNFDPGKTAFIPGFGRIEDAEMDQLVAAGLARNFPVECVPFEALPLMGGRIEVAVPRRDAPDSSQPAGP